MASDKKPGLRVRVTAMAERMARAGHPWIFAESVREQNREGAAGELAVIFDRQDRFLAVGLWDPASPIRLRILHAGKPEKIDGAWLRARLARAGSRREGLFDTNTTGFRCVNGENDGLPGLILDRYAETLVLKLYTTAWLPWREELWRDLVTPTSAARRLVLRLSRNIQAAAEESFGARDGQVVLGEPLDGPVIFLENGLRLESDPLRGQKTGFFLDQRDNRLAVRRLAAGKTVLNLFSFSGGFSLSAAAGGATGTHSLDISEHALEAARRNFALNQDNPSIATCRHETIRADAFVWLRNKPETRYGVVILDPPSLAKRASEKAEALLAYEKLLGAAIERVQPGGVLLACSCSAHVTREEFFSAARAAAQKSGRRFEELETTGHAADHPATFREGEYLKAIYVTIH